MKIKKLQNIFLKAVFSTLVASVVTIYADCPKKKAASPVVCGVAATCADTLPVYQTGPGSNPGSYVCPAAKTQPVNYSKDCNTENKSETNPNTGCSNKLILCQRDCICVPQGVTGTTDVVCVQGGVLNTGIVNVIHYTTVNCQ